jgi:superfamily II DNA helicase RecQ
MSKRVNWLEVANAPKVRARTLSTSVPEPTVPEPKVAAKPPKAQPVYRAEPAAMILSPDDERLRNQLRKRRLELARLQNVPAYVIFDDKTLTQLALAKPCTIEELLAVRGVGPARANKLAEHFLPLFQAAAHGR